MKRNVTVYQNASIEPLDSCIVHIWDVTLYAMWIYNSVAWIKQSKNLIEIAFYRVVL